MTGIGVLTRSLLLELASRGDFRFLGMAHGPAVGAQELEAAGVETESHPAPLGVIWQQLVLPRRLAKGDIDLFWSSHMTLPWHCPVPSVLTVHDLTALLLPEHHRAKNRWSVYPFFRRSVEQAGRIVTISEATAADLRFQFPDAAAKIRVIHPGIDSEFRPGTPEAIAKTREELGLPDGYVLYLGTLEPRKNVHRLVDAWEALRRDDESTPALVLVGPYGWKSEPLVERLARLRPLGVHHLGPVPRERVVRILQAATLFAWPSLYEGFGLPAAEALACGIPTVVSNRGSLPEVVGKAAIQVEAEDAGALATAIRSLLADPAKAKALGARGPERVARFNWKRAGDLASEVLEEALALP